MCVVVGISVGMVVAVGDGVSVAVGSIVLLGITVAGSGVEGGTQDTSKVIIKCISGKILRDILRLYNHNLDTDIISNVIIGFLVKWSVVLYGKRAVSFAIDYRCVNRACSSYR